MPEMCAALKAARQGHYAWKSRPPSAHAMRDEELAIAISQVRNEVRGIYGAPKTFMRLRALGVRTSRKRVARIMRERGWRGVTRACAKRPSGEKRASKRESPDDLVKRRFEAGGPNAARFADIAYVKTRQGWLHLALVMDIWSRRIAGRSTGPNITAELADEALKMAMARRNPPEGCVHHSDHGSQCVSLLLSKTMRDRGIRPSMGVDLVAVGQRGHGVAHGHREAGMRARAHLRHARGGRAGSVRVHRGRLQQGEDPLGAGLPQPGGVREGQLACGR